MDLEHLWVLPETMGTGVGRALFDDAMKTAAAVGAAAVKIEPTRMPKASTNAWGHAE